MSVKTELEYLLRETVEQVRAEKLASKKSGGRSVKNTLSGGARFMINSQSSAQNIHAGGLIS